MGFRGDLAFPLMLLMVGLGKGMYFGGMSHQLSYMPWRKSAGRCLVISEEMGRWRIQRDANLWSLVRVKAIGGMYISICIISNGVL